MLLVQVPPPDLEPFTFRGFHLTFGFSFFWRTSYVFANQSSFERPPNDSVLRRTPPNIHSADLCEHLFRLHDHCELLQPLFNPGFRVLRVLLQEDRPPHLLDLHFLHEQADLPALLHHALHSTGKLLQSGTYGLLPGRQISPSRVLET